MDHPDWVRIQEIYDLALPLPPAERAAFVAQECHGDQAMANEVNELLQAHESSGDFLNSSLFEMGLEVISNSEDELIGTIVDGRYRVIQMLAAGGMGKLYLAEDSNLHDQLVALKVLSQTLLPDAERRFKQEVHALTLVKHPNIVRVLGAGQLPGGKPYIVIEYIEGVTLRSLIPSGGMDRKCAASMLKDIGAALGHIHNQGIVHRDLKPENIMVEVSDDGTESVKIVDFGIAKVENSVVTGTVHNVPIGTLPYMSPEQKRGDEIKPASDIYAMAVIAYEMVNGKRPLDQTSTPVRRGRLPRKAYNLILRGLSEEPASRPQSAKQFGEDLSIALSKKSLPDWLKVAAGVLVVALLAYGISSFIDDPPPPPAKGFDYWLTVQPMHDGKAYGDAYKSNGKDDTFGNGDSFQLNVRSTDSGFLYILNEGTAGFRLLHPSKAINNGSASIGADQTVQLNWATFHGPPGTENFWIIWSVLP
ncbi:MAG TPA: protein kinase, partial [Pyrinomonadaceae bacterium]|nr:protein kinase [Pyrinomonadaceae bacterium]